MGFLALVSWMTGWVMELYDDVGKIEGWAYYNTLDGENRVGYTLGRA